MHFTDNVTSSIGIPLFPVDPEKMNFPIIDSNQKVLILPIHIYHASAAASLDETYFTTLLKYARMHKKIPLIRI